MIVVLAVCIISAGIFVGVHRSTQPEVTKVIKAKLAPLEPGVSTLDLEVHIQTVHYLVAEDGTVVKVGVGVYGATEIGSEFTSSDWETK